jgi:hypothetical protein
VRSQPGSSAVGGRKVGRKRRKEKKEKRKKRKGRNRKWKRNRKWEKIGKGFRKIRRISREN